MSNVSLMNKKHILEAFLGSTPSVSGHICSEILCDCDHCPLQIESNPQIARLLKKFSIERSAERDYSCGALIIQMYYKDSIASSELTTVYARLLTKYLLKKITITKLREELMLLAL